MSHHCPLCNTPGKAFHQIHFQCPVCSGIFMDKSLHPNPLEETEHYNRHENNVEDKAYQNFVSPITSSVLRDFTTSHKGLDFGAGTGPVISKVLNDHGFTILQYDPYFHKYPELLRQQYDYIACCEVIEHFYNPHKEFKLLKQLLSPGGKLYCMTHIYDESIDFDSWYYKNDPTHVFIYHANTLQWIRKEMGFKEVKTENRLIVFSV